MRYQRFTPSRFALASIVVLGMMFPAAPAKAITFVFACFCCKPDGSLHCVAGWSEFGCGYIETIGNNVLCDELFNALVIPPSGGVGNGYAPAFDRAVTLGSPVVEPDGTVTRIVQGIYPAPDMYVPGSSTYSTRLFAIRESANPGVPNQFAPLDIILTGLDPAADSIDITAVPGGEPIPDLLSINPGPVIAGGDASIVVRAYRAVKPCCDDPTNDCTEEIHFATLAWQDALDLPPACLGDCDRSGMVSFADVTTTLANFNQTYPVGVLTPGDANGDRVVNFSDITAILANLGQTCG